MHHRLPSRLIAGFLLACGLSNPAHAVLQGRDLNGSTDSFEAYYDTALDITWLADANYAKTSGYHASGLMNWTDANTWAASLSLTDSVHVYDNWRLPTVEPRNGMGFNYGYTYDGTTDAGYNLTSPQSEMAYMFYVTLGNSGYFTKTGAVTGCYGTNCLDNTGPFSSLQSFSYWSGTEYGNNPAYAWSFKTLSGLQTTGSKAEHFAYAWAVSPGDVAAVPEAQTYGLMLAGLGLVGWRVRRQKQFHAGG